MPSSCPRICCFTVHTLRQLIAEPCQVLKASRDGEVAPVGCQTHIPGLMQEIERRCFSHEGTKFLQLLGVLSGRTLGISGPKQTQTELCHLLLVARLPILDRDFNMDRPLSLGVKNYMHDSRQCSRCGVASSCTAQQTKRDRQFGASSSPLFTSSHLVEVTLHPMAIASARGTLL